MRPDGDTEEKTCPTDFTYLWDPEWDRTKIATTAGSEEQRRLGLMTLSAFFRGFVADYPRRAAYQRVFDPQYQIPDSMSALTQPARESLWHDLAEVVIQQDSTSGSLGTLYRDEVSALPTTGHERALARIQWDPSTPDLTYDALLWPGGRVFGGNWIISSSLARYQDSEGDPLEDEALDARVRLLFVGGTESDSVNLATYVELTNHFNEVPTCEQLGVETAASGQCLIRDAGNDCPGAFSPYPADTTRGDCVVSPQHSLLLFHEIPIELQDFDSGDGSVFSRKVEGLRFEFTGTPRGQLFIDRAFILRVPFKGDVNADGEVTVVDGLMTAQHYVGTSVQPFNENAADVNCDGTVTIVDALMIAQHYVGLIDRFPCSR